MSLEEFQELFFGMMAEISGGDNKDGYVSESEGPFGADSKRNSEFFFVGGDDLTRTPLYELVGDPGVQCPLVRSGGDDVWGIYGAFHGFAIESKPVSKHNRSGDKEAVRLYLKTPKGKQVTIQMGLGTMVSDSLLRSLQLLANTGKLSKGCPIHLDFQRGEEDGKVSKAVFLNLFTKEDDGYAYVNTIDTPYAFIKSNPALDLTERGRIRALEQKTRASNILAILDQVEKDEF